MAGMAGVPGGAPLQVNMGGVAGMAAAAAPLQVNMGGVAGIAAAAAPLQVNQGGVVGMAAAAAPLQVNQGGVAGMAGAPHVAPLQPNLGGWDIEGPLMGPAFRKSEVGPFYFP